MLSLGSKDITTIRTHTGIRQQINKTEIITTILATLWSRLELSPWSAIDDVFRHLILLCRCATSITVQVTVTISVIKGMMKLLIAKVIPSTLSLSGVEIIPICYLFFDGTHFQSSLLTANTGVPLNRKTTYMHTMITHALFGVNMFFTCRIYKTMKTLHSNIKDTQLLRCEFLAV
jgi:hypothetical protein